MSKRCDKYLLVQAKEIMDDMANDADKYLLVQAVSSSNAFFFLANDADKYLLVQAMMIIDN